MLDNMHQLDTEESLALDEREQEDRDIETHELDQIYQLGEE